jgi:sec-independent protein translocase protein TatB
VFGISGVELAIIIIFAFLVFGPDKLPKVIRYVSRIIRKFRTIQADVTKVVREEVYNPLKDPINEMKSQTIDPLTKPVKELADNIKEPLAKPLQELKDNAEKPLVQKSAVRDAEPDEQPIDDTEGKSVGEPADKPIAASSNEPDGDGDRSVNGA